MRKSRFSIVQKDIEIFFHNHTTHGLTHENISDILYINNKKWKLPKNLGKFKFKPVSCVLESDPALTPSKVPVQTSCFSLLTSTSANKGPL